MKKRAVKDVLHVEDRPMAYALLKPWSYGVVCLTRRRGSLVTLTVAGSGTVRDIEISSERRCQEPVFIINYLGKN